MRSDSANDSTDTELLRRRPRKKEKVTFRGRLLAVLQSKPLLNSLVTLAVTVGFFHGWLKLEIRNPLITFLFDGLLGAALALTWFRMKRSEYFLPRDPVGDAMRAFFIIVGLYLLLPVGPPLVIKLAATRGWCFGMLIYCLGYHLTESIDQVRGYFYVIIILGLLTSLYGMRQTADEIERRMIEDALFADRYRFTFYADEGGERVLRVFSTFVSAGAFGGTLAYVIVLTVIVISDRSVKVKERWLLVIAATAVSYGMMLSGSRSSLLTVGIGFVMIAWYRRSLHTFIIAPALLIVALKLTSDFTGGASLHRFSSLFDLEGILNRNLIPTQIGWQFMMDNPFGGGLGKSGYSVPFFLIGRSDYRGYHGADGDLGRLMIEMGFVGLFFFGRVLLVAAKAAWNRLNALRDSAASTVVLASATCFAMALSSFPSGSPFLGIPMGAMVWFFLGTLQKLSDPDTTEDEAWNSRSIHAGSDPTTGTDSDTDSDTDRRLARKRFLYYRPPGTGKKNRFGGKSGSRR